MFFAYLDAGSGSLILQAILGGAAGIAVAWKAWRAKISGRPIPVEDAPSETGDTALTTEP